MSPRGSESKRRGNISTENYWALQSLILTQYGWSYSDTVNNEKLAFCRQTGRDMKADWGAGSGFQSEWLLINGADEGHNSSPALRLPQCKAVQRSQSSTCCWSNTLIVWAVHFFTLEELVSISLRGRRKLDHHSDGESEAHSSSKDQAFFTPYQYEKPVASKWFPKPQVICLCLSPWLHLQDSKIKRTCCSSKMSSKCLNSSGVIKYSSMDVSARVPAESRRTENHWCLLYTVIKVNEWNKIRGN